MANADNTPQQKSLGRKGRQSATPLVVRQILSSNQNEMKLFAMPVRIAILVGIVRDLTISPDKITFILEDHTGRIRATAITDSDEQIPTLTPNTYAQIFATITVERGARALAILKIFPINDNNAITCHLLQAILTRLEAEAHLKKQVSCANVAGAALINALMPSTEPQHNNPHLDPLQEEIFQIIKTENVTQYGINKRNILMQFPAYQAMEVQQAVDYLISVGRIYNTVNSDYYKAIDQ